MWSSGEGQPAWGSSPPPCEGAAAPGGALRALDSTAWPLSWDGPSVCGGNLSLPWLPRSVTPHDVVHPHDASSWAASRYVAACSHPDQHRHSRIGQDRGMRIVSLLPSATEIVYAPPIGLPLLESAGRFEPGELISVRLGLGQPGGGEQRGRCGPPPGGRWPASPACRGWPNSPRVDTVVLEIQSQQRRPGWVQILHRDTLRGTQYHVSTAGRPAPSPSGMPPPGEARAVPSSAQADDCHVRHVDEDQSQWH
jgi:hypothetical protein